MSEPGRAILESLAGVEICPTCNNGVTYAGHWRSVVYTWSRTGRLVASKQTEQLDAVIECLRHNKKPLALTEWLHYATLYHCTVCHITQRHGGLHECLSLNQRPYFVGGGRITARCYRCKTPHTQLRPGLIGASGLFWDGHECLP